MTLQVRKPTGRPSWPILVLAGREGAGKTWAAIAASASPLIGRTIYVGFGENDPDEYALIPGAHFDIAVHDGTYQGLLGAVRDAVAEPAVEKPTLLVLDSGTRLWNVIGDNMQAIANKRANGKRNQASGDYTISTDLWNVAASQWQDVMDALRDHHGPVIVTARLDPVTVMENGQPTKQKDWKVQAHKSLVFDADAVVEMRERGQFLLSKVKSVRNPLDKPRPYPGFTVDGFFTTLGLADGTGVRGHATVVADRSGVEPQRVLPEPPARSAPAPEQGAANAWVQVKAKIDACSTRTEFKTLIDSGVGNLAGRVIPGDPQGRKVGEYLDHVWSHLPDVDSVTGEVKDADMAPEAPATGPEQVEWHVRPVPAGEPATEADSAAEPTTTGVGVDDETPF